MKYARRIAEDVAEAYAADIITGQAPGLCLTDMIEVALAGYAAEALNKALGVIDADSLAASRTRHRLLGSVHASTVDFRKVETVDGARRATDE